MTNKNPLKKYKQKRDFRKTGEPKGGKKPDAERVYVVQLHDASNLHYDFRIQIGEVLKSWTVPKGPSTDPREKRLAVLTEDHPIDYADFEGVIPEGEYGAGTVLVWDRGTYSNLKEKDDEEKSMEQSFEDGHITIRLDGEKLKGGYALTRFKTDDGDNWLLVKMDDEEADARRNPVSTQPESVLSGRTLDEITDGEKE